ncbi:MAG TPA: hypothetical protein PLW14_07020 [Chlorobiota bacterium]|nr:hypothetical protein [Chlorobiota bacterium]
MKRETKNTQLSCEERLHLWKQVWKLMYRYRYALIINILVVTSYVLWVNSFEEYILWLILLVSTPSVAGGTSIVLGIAAYDDDRSRVLVLIGISAIIVSVVMFVFVVL